MKILDSCIWVALMNKKDSCHERAISLVENLASKDIRLYDHIYAEVLNVLRNKYSDALCLRFIYFLEEIGINTNMITEKAFIEANQIFFKYKHLSFTDALLLATAKHDKAELVTFDKRLKAASG